MVDARGLDLREFSGFGHLHHAERYAHGVFGPDGPGGQQKGYRYETQFFHRSAYFTQHDPQMSPPWVLQLEARSPPTYLPANMPFWSLLPMNAEYNTPSR